MPRGDERRIHPRHPARLEVFVLRRHDSSRAVLVAATRDLSLGGMFISADRPLPRGTVLDIEAFRSDCDEPPVRARAVVRWRRRWRRPRGMGVEIVQLLGEGRERLRSWLSGELAEKADGADET